MARPTLRDVHVNGPLSNISIAYGNEAYIADQIFPNVPVTKKSDVYFIYDKDAFFRNKSGLRAPGTRAPRADFGITTASYVCINDSLAFSVPDETVRNADVPIQPMVDATNYVTDQVLLGLEIRVADIVTASSGTWGYSASPTTQWSSDTSDPWGDIMAGIDGVVSTIGRMPNKAVMSWDVWRYLQNHPDFLDRIKHTRSGAKLEVSDLAGWFGFDALHVGTSLKDSSLEGQTASPAFVWGDGFWLGYVAPNPSLRTPSAGYVFQWGSKTISTYRETQEHNSVVECEWFTDEVVSASVSGAIIYDAV